LNTINRIFVDRLDLSFPKSVTGPAFVRNRQNNAGQCARLPDGQGCREEASFAVGWQSVAAKTFAAQVFAGLQQAPVR
jgi:hypothetical protein